MAKKVLIVEDDIDLREWLTFELETEGYEVISAENGATGLEAAQSSPHLILLDIQLPDIDGFEVCEALQARPETAIIPIIFLTARTGLASKLSGFDSGAIDYITKPFMIDELKARIKAVLRSRNLEQQQAEANLERYKTHLSQNLSHELRTPMSVILSALDIMDHTVAHNRYDQLEKVIETAQTGAYRLYWLIQDLLIVNKLTQGNIPIFHHHTELAPIIEITIDQLRIKYATKKLTFIVDVAPTDQMPMLRGHLTDILRHLLDNACKFSDSNSVITLAMIRAERHQALCIEDQGVGIPEEQHEPIFGQFYQIDMSTTRAAQGMGVGLFIARSLARLYNGDIIVHSEVNQGSRFCLSVPFEEQGV